MSRQVPSYELADAIEKAIVDGFAFGYISEAVTMLRKLQAEIEALKAKTLTDEEIEQIASQYLTAHAQFIGAGEVCYEGEIEFARAILKKANEK
jgi:hypothetical protein